MSQITLNLLSRSISLVFDSLPSGMGTSAAFSRTPLDSTAESFILREDNAQSSTAIRIFNRSRGELVYSFERYAAHSSHWHVYKEPSREKIATIYIHLIDRHVEHLGAGNTPLRLDSGILGKFHRHFYSPSGELFSWNRRSQALERVTNPGGAHEESRAVVAQAHRLRASKFDWEVLIDTAKIDILTVLSTAFVTMRTQWFYTAPAAPSLLPLGINAAETIISAEVNDSETDGLSTEEAPRFVNNDLQKLLVFEPAIATKEPRAFFNPPEFLQYQSA